MTQEYVQNWTSTTFPRRPFDVSGGELIHAVAEPSDASSDVLVGALMAVTTPAMRMSRFTEATDQYIPYLLRKAEHIEDYLQK